MPLPGNNAEPQRSEMYELTAADFRDGLAGHGTVLPTNVLPNGNAEPQWSETGRLGQGKHLGRSRTDRDGPLAQPSR